jgi:hypothetical protein
MQLRPYDIPSPLVTRLVEWAAERIRTFREARTRRREESDRFYRNLANYCLAHNVSPICDDDWKTHR